MIGNKFSVLISVYQQDNTFYFSQALDSIISQTLSPNEIVIVKDGPLNRDLDIVLSGFIEKYSIVINIKVVAINENIGLGGALNIGILNCSNDYIVRMDSDDICKIDRFEKLVNFIHLNPEYTIVGSSIEEFCNTPGDINKFRVLPKEGIELYKYSKFRNPINHPSIVFRKKEILNIGSYRADLRFFEDFAFAINVLNSKGLIYNISESLLHFRVGENFKSVKRRHGLRYLIYEFNFLKYSYKIGHINKFETLLYFFLKLPLRILPFPVLKFVYSRFLRQKETNKRGGAYIVS